MVKQGTTPGGNHWYRCRESLLGQGRPLFLALAGPSPDVQPPIVAMAMKARGRRETARV
jgi:hypothetical protein